MHDPGPPERHAEPPAPCARLTRAQLGDLRAGHSILASADDGERVEITFADVREADLEALHAGREARLVLDCAGAPQPVCVSATPTPTPAQEQAALEQFDRWRTRERLGSEHGWRALSWQAEHRGNVPRFVFTLECERGDAGCDPGDRIDGFASSTGVDAEQWS